MELTIVSSKLLKPIDEGGPPTSPLTIPLTIFDMVTYNTHIAVMYAFRPPIASNSSIETGLAKALSQYRVLSGRITLDANAKPVIKLNDEGVRFIEATVDGTLDKLMPAKPSPELLSLHQSLQEVEELLQVQLTRFTCGSLVVGVTSHHHVADGQAISHFLVAWGQATRGIPINFVPLHDRITFFAPTDSPKIEFDHRGVEFTQMEPNNNKDDYPLGDKVTVRKIHLTEDFLSMLKAKTSFDSKRRFTTFECLMALLWRVVTMSRGLPGYEITKFRIAVNGRTRISPPLLNNYFGNLVLWAFPSASVKELRRMPLHFAAGLIQDAVGKVNESYFRSFIDFANTGVVEKEGLVTTADASKNVLSPDLEVNSWTRFPFCDLDFGGGNPHYFMPGYLPEEGSLIVAPSLIGDGSIDVFISLFQHHLSRFNDIMLLHLSKNVISSCSLPCPISSWSLLCPLKKNVMQLRIVSN